ncbi:MAG: DUF2271 domain-containing protein [Spirochaetales bacterium]|nr:DUF2271 domain-containing protein [Spirochaetales bacterium]
MKMKIYKKCIVIFLLILIFGLIPLGAQGLGLEVFIEPGVNYSHWKWFGILPVKLTPQIAVWVENEEGEIIQTLLVSRRGGEGSWRGADEGRPEALPVFTHKNKSTELDSVTSATPKGNKVFCAASGESLSEGRYIVFAEVNSSFDYNNTYPETEGDVNGQPSLIYYAEVALDQDAGEIDLVPLGTGAVQGDSGEVFPGVEGLTSALSILSSIRVQQNL